jgi:hypothetical protein
MIIHQREAADGDCEDLCQFFEPVLDPAFRSCGPSPSKKARRTQREMQCYQRVTVVSINCERAIAIGRSAGGCACCTQTQYYRRDCIAGDSLVIPIEAG